MEEEVLDIEGIKKIVDEFKKWALHPDKTLLGFVASCRINRILEELQSNPEDLTLLKTGESLLETLRDFPLELNLWKSQNIYFTLCKGLYSKMQERSESGDPLAQDWIAIMKGMGRHLHVVCI
jgi:hypothetical protein